MKISQPKVDTAQIGFSGLESDAVVIEKHTFARIISDEIEETELPARFDEAERPVQQAPLLPAPETQALTSPVVIDQRKKRRMIRAGVGAGVLVVFQDDHTKWSPDGARIAFVVEYHGAVANIFETPAEGGKLNRLTVGPKFDGRHTYSPDGTKLAFESNRNGNYEIYVMSLR